MDNFPTNQMEESEEQNALQEESFQEDSTAVTETVKESSDTPVQEDLTDVSEHELSEHIVGEFSVRSGEEKEISVIEEAFLDEQYDVSEGEVADEWKYEKKKIKRKRLVPLPPLEDKDFSKEDPKFLDEFDSTIEEVSVELFEEHEEEVEEEEVESSDEDKYAVYKCDSPVPYDEDICVDSDVESTDSHYESVETRVKEQIFKSPSEIAIRERRYLREAVVPELIWALAEVTLYQPSNPYSFVSEYLKRSQMTREELDMDPDPRDIQKVVELYQEELGRLRERRRKSVVTPPGRGEGGEASVLSSMVRRLAEEEKRRKEKEERRMKMLCSSLFLKGMREKYRSKDVEAAKARPRRDREWAKAERPKDCLGPTTLVNGFYIYGDDEKSNVGRTSVKANENQPPPP